MNKGINLATGDIIGILNSDDFYTNNYIIEDVANCFNNNSQIDLLIGNIIFFNPKNENIISRFFSSKNFQTWKLRFGFMPAHPATFVKRSAYEKVGLYKLGYKIGADFEWFVRAIKIHKLKFVYFDQTVVKMREGGVSSSGLKSYWISSIEIVRALRENGVYSNIIFVLFRLPIKYFQKILIKLKLFLVKN